MCFTMYGYLKCYVLVNCLRLKLKHTKYNTFLTNEIKDKGTFQN